MMAALLAAGCYSPSPPSGAYLCAADNACPSGQKCACGLCVTQDSQAACSLTISTGADRIKVAEHQLFPITVSAFAGNGQPATGFNGAVTLTSSWGDVTPSRVTLSNGVATNAMVSLNRETLAPATATITATFNGRKAQSGKIAVELPAFVRDATPIVDDPTLQAPFGPADAYVSQPDVVKTADGYRMYFVGGKQMMLRTLTVIGVATSSDGKKFTAQAAPVLDFGDRMDISAPSAYELGGATQVAYGIGMGINLASSADGLSGFTINAMQVLHASDCAYCKDGIGFPSVIEDDEAGADGGLTNRIMFFSALNASGVNKVSIGRASSSDGTHFTPEPAPLLSGDLFGELFLASPHVIRDGTVYKMFYSFARLGGVTLDKFCDPATKISIGYATSSDGFFWVRSPSNPVIDAGSGTGWDGASRTLLAGSVVPADGNDPSSGYALYYTTFLTRGLACVPAIARAVRP
jgi:hypothetical protein